MAKPVNIPLFPLGLVLYPGEQLPLHIFEQRYKEMIADCLKHEKNFGVLFLHESKMAEVGCTARVEEVVRNYEDGRLDILVIGESRFRVDSLLQEKAYLTGSVELIVEPKEPAQVDLRERVITQHMRLLELAGRKVRPYLYQQDTGVSYFIAHNSGLNPDQKQEVLELLTENERNNYLVSHLETLLPRVEQFEDVRRRVQSNGHFKDFPPEAPPDEL